MGDTVRITMMGDFLIYINEQHVENPVSKSRKGTALMEFLVLHRGRPVPNQQLLHALWPEHSVSNPENALKTLVSRMRTLLNQMSEDLGTCIVSDRGAYHWRNLPGMRIDVMDLMDLYDAVGRERDTEVQRGLYQQILELYKGDLYQTGDLDGDLGFAQQMHNQFLQSIYGYIELLRKAEDFNEICSVCRAALEVDSFDDRLHIELMPHQRRAGAVQARHEHDLSLPWRAAQPGDGRVLSGDEPLAPVAAGQSGRHSPGAAQQQHRPRRLCVRL